MISRAVPFLCGLLVVAMVHAQSTDTAREAGRSAAESAVQSYGTEDALHRSGEAINTDVPMRTAAGQEFDGRVSCEASSEFLRVTILPNATNDIDQFVMEIDADLNGSFERSEIYAGPFAGVCNDGVVQCTAGTFEDCEYFEWETSSGSVDLQSVGPSSLGACYCFNNSCGSNLLWVNRTKVLSDLTTAIAHAALQIDPRLNLGRAEAVDEVSMRVYGGRSSCLTDTSPEQYFTNPADMAADGAVITATLGTVPYVVMNSSVAGEHSESVVPCTIRRTIPAVSLTSTDIIDVLDRTSGTTMSCGVGCVRYSIGQAIDNSRSGGNCTVFSDRQRTDVRRGDRITSARIVQATFDDYLQVRTQGDLSWTSDAFWTGTGVPAPRCERRRNFNVFPSTDLTTEFQAGGLIETMVLNAVGGEGEGRAILEVNYEEGCAIEPEVITNGCAALEANPRCGIRSERVDGVQTIANYLTTGLAPLPSSQALGTGACATEIATRDWWVTEREYTCPSEDSDYDFSAAEERYRTVHGSMDVTTGNFDDRRILEDGTVEVSSETTVLPDPDTFDACQRTCRTRRPRPGVEVGGGLNRSELNSTGVAYDFTFRECSPDNVCPAEPEEDIVSACDCRSNFAQAAAMMQTIRMVKEDMVCAPPP